MNANFKSANGLPRYQYRFRDKYYEYGFKLGLDPNSAIGELYRFSILPVEVWKGHDEARALLEKGWRGEDQRYEERGL